MGDVLFLAHRIPYPPDKGDKIRSWHMLRYLSQRVRVHLGAFVDDPDDFRHAAALQARCESVHLQPLSTASRPWRAARGLMKGEPLSIALFEDGAMTAWVRRTIAAQNIRAILAFSGQMAPYALPHTAGRRAVMDFVDLDSDKWAQYAKADGGIRGRLYRREARTLLAFERMAAARFDASLFVSEDEARLFRAQAGGNAGRVLAVSNGVDTEFFDPDADFSCQPAEPHELAGPIVTFVGAMDYKPNQDAAQWFADAVWPAILAVRPEARFFIVGSKPPAHVTALGERAGITVTGRVADVRPYLAAAAVVVAPLRIARGIQNKVLEAMAMAKAVVATPQAYEGIEAEPPRELVVEAEPAAQAAAVLKLIADPSTAVAIGKAARHRMLARYGWDANLGVLDELLALGGPRELKAA